MLLKYTKPGLILVIFCALALLPVRSLAAQPCRWFQQTGHQICGRLLDYWDQNGNLTVFGYPIADQNLQTLDGRQVEFQLFERNRLELHPENTRPYDVLLGRLGADSLQRAGRDWQKFAQAGASTPHYFAQTGHAIAPEFWSYWSSHGLEFDGQAGTSFEESLALFGLPLSDSAIEVNATDGQRYLTQWFERARFEAHPEHAGTPYQVQLGLLSEEQASAGSAPAPAIPDFAAQVIELVNQQRVGAGCPALSANATLMKIAQEHSQDMASHDFFGHTGSDGRSTFGRMQDAGYRYKRAAENVAAGTPTPADTVALWMNSPGHRANILNCQLLETGVGLAEDLGDALDYRWYWTQDFGAR